MQAKALPLIGVTILDLTRVLAGPYCTRLLSDLGARVIKIERPGEGDEMRRNYLQLEAGRSDQSSYFTRVNAGKESVGVDLSQPEGQAIIHDLAKVADVVVENFMPGVVTRLRCDYESLRIVKPDIIYCSISGFGQTGPWRSRPAFAHIINAVSGLMHSSRATSRRPGRPTSRPPTFWRRLMPRPRSRARSYARAAPARARTSTCPCWKHSSLRIVWRMRPCSMAARSTAIRVRA